MPSSHATSTRSLLLLIGPFSSSLHPYPYPRYDMKQIFAQFDADGDGKLDIYEIARAFRALGLPKVNHILALAQQHTATRSYRCAQPHTLGHSPCPPVPSFESDFSPRSVMAPKWTWTR